MSRLITGVIALAVLTAPFGQAKPPDLPENPIITVHPIQYLPVEFQTTPAAAAACPSVLDNLKKLIDAGDDLLKARQDAEAGNLTAALVRLNEVRKLVPGTSLDEDCKALARLVMRKVNVSIAEEPCCPCCETFTKTVRCWLSQIDGKAVMVDGLLKAAHLALGEGRTEKASELLRQAHALSPERVEADPLAYKLGLLEGRKGGAEEASEPVKPLPDHPRQVRKPAHSMTMSIDVQSRVKHVADMLVSAQFKLEGPPKDANGVVMFGLTATGKPTLMLHARNPGSGRTWHVSVGGPLPVVWVTGTSQP